MKRMTFVAAMKDYFGQGQLASSFLQELKQLTDKDKDEFRRLLPSVGYEIVTTLAA